MQTEMKRVLGIAADVAKDFFWKSYGLGFCLGIFRGLINEKSFKLIFAESAMLGSMCGIVFTSLLVIFILIKYYFYEGNLRRK